MEPVRYMDKHMVRIVCAIRDEIILMQFKIHSITDAIL